MDDATVAHLATNLWRLLKRFDTASNGEVSKTQRLTTRNLSAMSERLTEVGVRIQDHDGLRFDTGMALEVIAYEPRPNLTEQTVVETVLPSIYRSGKCIQLGQVIVGVPEKGQDDGSRDD